MKGRCPNYESVFYSRFTTLNLKARLKRESLTPEESRQIESVYTEQHERFVKSISMKRFTSLLLALVFVLTSMPFAPITADTIAAPGEISITKTAVPVSNDPDNRDYNVTLTAQGTELISKVPVDVVLVLDTSGSMQGDRLSVVKTAANNFAASVIDNNNMARVSIVSYAGSKGDYIYVKKDNITYNNDVPYNDAKRVIPLTNDKSALGLAINGLSANGGTNIEAGFYEARQELINNGRNNAEKIVILMTDGEPTYAYTNAIIQLTAGYHRGAGSGSGSWVSGIYSNSDGITYGHGNAYNDEYKDKAIAEAFRIKNNHDAKIFTVGFNASANMTENIRKVLDPAGTDKYHEQYFEASNESGINAAFEDISNQINAVAKNAKIVDIINEDFQLVAGSASGAEINGQKLTWNIGDIFDDEKSVTFTVRAKNNIYGAAYTNEAAYLYFDTPEANTFYDDDQFNNPDSAIANEKRLTFEKPVVEVPPIAANDDFYSIKVGTTLEANTTALSVLANDPSNKMQSVTGWTTTSVIAVKTSEPSQGDLTEFNPDGTFTYVSNEDASGTDSFTYNIVTTVQHGSGEVRTLRDSATVTISILPTYALAVVYEDIDNGATLTPVTNPNLGKAYAAGETYNVEVAAIADYDYVGPKTGSSLTGEMPANSITVTLLYEKKTVNSTIVYYKNGQEIETVTGPSGEWGSSPKMSETQINKHLTEGYSVSGNPANYTITLDKVSANNVYRVYYTVNQYPVTVEYYYINNLTIPFDTTSLGNYAYGSEITSVNDALHTNGTYDRDTSSSTTLPFAVGTSGNTIKVVYVSKPVAADDIASTDANDPVTIDVLGNDSDPLGSPLSLTGIVTGPTDGSVVLNNDGKYVYTPKQNFTGTDSFVYGIKNSYNKTDTATVTITIKPWQPITVHYIDEATSLALKNSFSESLRAGTSLDSVAGLDKAQPDIPGFTNKGIKDNIIIPSTMPEAPLEITYLYSRNSYDYTINYYFENSGALIESKTNSAPYQSVIDTVTDTTEVDLTVYDRFNVTGLPLTIDTDTSLNVINVYYAAKPQANPDAVTINPNEEIDINVLSNDTDIDGNDGELKVKSITQPASGNGTTSFDDATGIVTYTPAANDSANTVTFQYTIEDKQGLTSTATVTVTIRPFYNLTVKYVELDNESNVIDVKDPIKMRFNDPFTVVPDVIPGYNLVGNQNLTGIMPEGNHELIVYYSRANISYTVRHYYENSDTEIPDSESAGLTAEFGSVLGADDIANYASLPDGYNRFRVVFPNEATSLTISADANANIVEVYYAAEPVADDDAVTINPNETVIIDVLENDIDIDDLGNELVIESIDTTSISDFEGTASISSSGKTITYEPVSDAEDKVISFNYTVRDAQNQTSTATVTVTIRSFYTLTVYYRETDNDSVELLTPVVNEEYVYGQSYEATAEAITGYVPTGVVESRPVTGLGLTGNMPDNDLAIIVRYDRAEIAYTVEHYYEDDEFIGSDSLTALFEDEITATDVEDYAELPTGFARSRVEFPGDADSLVISADAENNVIRVYYTSTTPPTIPTIEVTESEPPLAPPATPTPTPVPTIEVIETKPPLAEPTPTVPTIEVAQEELPKAGERAPLWPIGMAMLLIAGGLTFIMHRKDKTEQ